MLLAKVRSTIEQNNLLCFGDSIICAVSGGADSVCLLHTMLSLRSEYNLKIYVANVNHLIRGEESDEDSAFVKRISKAADLELFYREYDVIKIARERKMGEEECGRALRYEFFEELSKSLGGAKIATAHNLNDNAETVIFRLARGTSARGIGGIKYKRENIIRPLLDVTRAEIEKYLRSNSLAWREDSTNTMPVYARNKLRLLVMPHLEEISKGAQRRIVAAAHSISEDDEFINECAKKIMEECFFGDFVLIEKLSACPPPIKRRICAYVLKEWNCTEITAEKVERFSSFAQKETGRRFDISAEAYAEKSYNKITLCSSDEKKDFFMTLESEGNLSSEDWTLSAYYSEIPLKRNGNNIAVFDGDKLSFPLTVRPRKDGDKIALKGIGGSKKLSDIFTDEKIERQERDRVPIVEKDGEILFVCGLRQASLFTADEHTRKFIIIKFERRK